MPFKIVRNDIARMDTQAIVNTANAYPEVGTGCDSAIYKAAGYEKLLAYRKEKIGFVPEGEVFLTPGFDLKAEYIIHAVSPLYRGGEQGEEEKLRSCYRKSLLIAKENHIRSIAFPLISTGGFGYPREEGMRIAVDEINAFLLASDMEIYLVVFDDRTVRLGGRICPGLEEYIDQNYVEEQHRIEYTGRLYRRADTDKDSSLSHFRNARTEGEYRRRIWESEETFNAAGFAAPESAAQHPSPAAGRPQKGSLFGSVFKKEKKEEAPREREHVMSPRPAKEEAIPEFYDGQHETELEERIRHLSDTFSQYLMYLIETKNLENADVYKRAIVDRKVFSKIKNNPDYHPQKLTVLCLCVGARLNLDESRDLLARAGYALSPCDKTDIIFSYFIENKIYDMIELDIQLEEHGLPCIIT